MRPNRRGFTMIELIIVVVVLLILSSMGMLRYIDLRREGYTTQISGDIDVIKLAAVGYWGEYDTWPSTSAIGSAPPELAPLLPAGFQWSKPFWNLGWVSDASPTAGIIIQSDDARMMEKIRQRFGTRLPFVDGGTYIMYVLSSPTSPF